MGLVEDALEGGVPGVLLGLGLAVAAPVVLPAVANGVRPVAKTVVRGWPAAERTTTAPAPKAPAKTGAKA
jgi:hypothetical protein